MKTFGTSTSKDGRYFRMVQAKEGKFGKKRGGKRSLRLHKIPYMKFCTRVACFKGCSGLQKKTENHDTKGEIRCILYIFLGVFMLYARALIGAN